MIPWTVRIALMLAALGSVFTVICFLKTTPMTMTLFFFIGIPAYGIGMLLYLWAVIQDLRQHGVL